MLYELRIYYILPGQMEAINDRFARSTLRIFEKHGMKVTDFWQDLDHDRLYYVMEFPDRDTRDRAFDTFRSDPEWVQIKNETEKDAPIVEKVESIFLNRVPYFRK